MSSKKEFVKGVMSVLRLESNIFVAAAVEEILDRVDPKDYTMFIAYLGERESDYEKPIQSIAHAVDELDKKRAGKKAKAVKMEWEEIKNRITSYIVHLTKKNTSKDIHEALKRMNDDEISPSDKAKTKEYLVWTSAQSDIYDKMIGSHPDDWDFSGYEDIKSFLLRWGISMDAVVSKELPEYYFYDLIRKLSIIRKIDDEYTNEAIGMIESEKVRKMISGSVAVLDTPIKYNPITGERIYR